MSEVDVTILVPAQDEAADLPRCLAAIAAQDYPHDHMQFVLADGGSTDGTPELPTNVLGRSGFADVVTVSNPGGSTPSNLNAGLGRAEGRVLCRIDARSIVPTDYVRRCVELLDARPDVAVVGGAQVAVPRGEDARSLGIARALNNRWGMGLSRYRRGAPSGPADTVYLGAFRTAELREAGGWNEDFATNQDFELNRRMARRGTVWFEAGLDVGYLPRQRVGDLFRQYRRFGRWKVRYWRSTGDRPQPRQLVLLGVAPAALIGVLLWWRLPNAAKVATATVAAAAVVGVESTGATRPAAGPAGHVVAVASQAAIAAGWSVGAWSGLMRRPHR